MKFDTQTIAQFLSSCESVTLLLAKAMTISLLPVNNSAPATTASTRPRELHLRYAVFLSKCRLHPQLLVFERVFGQFIRGYIDPWSDPLHVERWEHEG